MRLDWLRGCLASSSWAQQVEVKMRMTYIIRGINRWERALETIHFLTANIGLVEVSA
jgi:hypothetical protein